ncbi:hypothetical protein AVEN_220438-1 [Araneus ventricosus]|uniref:Uncharacterized protein n=1 Tax=Araneus ventricosus TaxID=182803 RepID=A0A4Y2ISH8_ARAVE|nr:hypothetical protein AVEN_220438-1 [Araneus ventricosus]
MVSNSLDTGSARLSTQQSQETPTFISQCAKNTSYCMQYALLWPCLFALLRSQREERAKVKFCVKLSKSITETLLMMHQVYGDAAIGRAVWCECYACFKDGRMPLKDEDRFFVEIQRESQKVLDTLREVDIQDTVQKWLERWEHYVAVD